LIVNVKFKLNSFRLF